MTSKLTGTVAIASSGIGHATARHLAQAEGLSRGGRPPPGPARHQGHRSQLGGYREVDSDDIADGVTHMVTRPPHTAIGEFWIMPTEQG
jgi:NADP-dependent 3-hydroxy acid dehydrogenase YdfG